MPVYSSHLDNYEGLRLGERIRQERQRLGVTLKELGGRVNISTARLSEIENGHHVLDLRQVVNIAEALTLPARFFLPQEAARPFQISPGDAERKEEAHAIYPQWHDHDTSPGLRLSLSLKTHLNTSTSAHALCYAPGRRSSS